MQYRVPPGTKHIRFAGSFRPTVALANIVLQVNAGGVWIGGTSYVVQYKGFHEASLATGTGSPYTPYSGFYVGWGSALSGVGIISRGQLLWTGAYLEGLGDGWGREIYGSKWTSWSGYVAAYPELIRFIPVSGAFAASPTIDIEARS